MCVCIYTYVLKVASYDLQYYMQTQKHWRKKLTHSSQKWQGSEGERQGQSGGRGTWGKCGHGPLLGFLWDGTGEKVNRLRTG